MQSAIAAHPEYFDVAQVRALFGQHCPQVIADPRDPALLAPIRQALLDQAPLSVIRLGDGEANLFTYGAYAGTPTLDRLVTRRILAAQADTFQPKTHDLVLLREVMLSAIAQADLVGVTGLWRVRNPASAEFLAVFARNVRGYSGHWRAIDYLLQLARRGWFRHKIVASAHLYFAVLDGLHALLPLARKVVVISNWQTIVQKLMDRHPAITFEHLPVGDSSPSKDGPEFLASIDAALPAEAPGCLYLIGAGPWAELYCSWVRQRGGVGVDVGSGLDLLTGAQTRPVHKKIDADKLRAYQL